MGELADSLVLDRSALAHNLKPLERDTLVQIVVDENDKRTRLAVLTEAGRAKLAESTPLWERAQQALRQYSGRKKRKSCAPRSNSSLRRSLPTPFSRGIEKRVGESIRLSTY